MFQSYQEILVQLLLLASSLLFQSFPLLHRIVLFGVSRSDFLSVDAALEHLDRGGIFW